MRDATGSQDRLMAGSIGGTHFIATPSSLQMVPYTARQVIRFMVLPVLNPMMAGGRKLENVHLAPFFTRLSTVSSKS